MNLILESDKSSDQIDQPFPVEQKPLQLFESNQICPEAYTDSSEKQKNPQKYDPFQGLSHIQKLKAQHDLSANKLVSFDQMSYIQVIFNPFSPSENKELITVQRCTPSVSKFSETSKNLNFESQIAKACNYNGTCLKDHQLQSSISTQKIVCKLCDKEVSEQNIVFICSGTGQKIETGVENLKCDYQICHSCNLKHYIRTNLVNQSPNQHTASSFKLHAVVQGLVNPGSSLSKKIGSNLFQNHISEKKRLLEIQNKLEKFENGFKQSVSTIESFANVLKDMRVYETVGSKPLAKYVLIGLWRQENCQYQCYRIFRIDNPLVFRVRQFEKIDKEFFHNGSNNQFLFFTKQKVENEEIICNYFDLKQAMAVVDDNLTKVSSQYFKTPVTKQYVFDGKEQNLLKLIFSSKDKFIFQNRVQILTLGSVQHLVFTVPFAWADDIKNWVKTDFNNIIFMNLDELTLPFVIYKADLLLDVIVNNNLPATLFYMRNKSFVEMEWGVKPSQNELTEEFLTNEEGFSPTQVYIRTFAYMPLAEQDFINQKNTLYKEITSIQKKESLKIGYMHKDSKNRQRVSINYTDGGIFSFILNERKDLNIKSAWLGEIGEIKNFKIDSFQIIDNQISGNGDGFVISGMLESEKRSWRGLYQQYGEDYEVNINHLVINEQGLVEGSGTDSIGDFNISGQLGKNKSIKFIKEYIGQHSIYYKGRINEDFTIIKGYWGFYEDDEQDTFQIYSNSKNETNLLITFDQQSWIKLNGSFNKQRAEIKGIYECSPDLKTQFGGIRQNSTFSLFGQDHQDSAVLQYHSSDLNDAVFFQDGKKLQVAGNVRFRDNQIDVKGYRLIEIDIINLDDFSTKNFVCQLPKSFQEVKTAKKSKMPYFSLMPLNCKKNQEGELMFQSQMFYYDQDQNCYRITFINGVDVEQSDLQNVDRQKYISKMIFPQLIQFKSENYAVVYPILAYKSDIPTNNELVICNLAKNVHQKYIDLSPFKFVQFVETSINPEKDLNPEADITCNTSVFFLVSYKDKYYLMVYRCFPWPLQHEFFDPQNVYRFQLHDQIQIVSGSIQLSNFKFDNPLRFTADKIQQTNIIKRQKSAGVQLMVVIQLVDQIICFNLNNPNYIQFFQDHGIMLDIFMQQSPGQQIYFAQRSLAGQDCLLQLTFIEKQKASTKLIFNSDTSQILQISVAIQPNYHDSQDHNKEGENHFIYILSSGGKIRRFSYNNQRKDQQVICDKILDLKQNLHSRAIISILKSNWSRTVIREKAITAICQPNLESEDLVGIVISPTSDLCYENEFFGFNDEQKFKDMKKGIEFKRKKCQILSLQQVQFSGKNIFQIQEAKKCYFLIQDQVGSRRRDLMRFDTEQSLRENLQLISNNMLAYKLKFTNQQILYNLQTFEFIENLQFITLNKLSHVENGVQYFAASKEFSQNERLDTVLKFTNDGKRINLFTNLSTKLNEIKNTYLTPLKTKNPNINLDIQDQNWLINHENEHILGVIAFCYTGAAVPLSDQQQKFNGKQIELQVQIINETLYKIYDNNLAESFQNKISNLKYNQEFPTVFLIKCNNWEAIKSTQTLFTKDYIVIKHGMHLAFAKINSIYEKNGSQLSQQNKSNTSNQKQQNSNKEEQKEKNFQNFSKIFEEEKCQIIFELINMAILSPFITKHGFFIDIVDTYDLKIAEKGEVRTNVIQISFKDVQITWDLDENKEVQFLTKPIQFADPIAFVTTGFTPRVFEDPNIQQMHLTQPFTKNENRQFICTPNVNCSPAQLMHTYSYICLLEVINIKTRFENNLAVSTIDFETMFQNFQGLTFFQIFRDKTEFLDLVINKIRKEGIQENVFVDENGEECDHIFIRMLYWTLNIPVIWEDIDTKIVEEAKHQPSLLQLIYTESQNQQLIDIYLKIIMFSREYRLSALVPNFQSFVKVFDMQSQNVHKFLQVAHFENSQSRSVESLMWHPDHYLVTFGSNYSLLSEDEIKRKVFKRQIKKMSLYWRFKNFIRPKPEPLKDELKNYLVEVKIIEIEWLSSNLEDFYMYLKKVSDQNLFGNYFIQVLLDDQDYSHQLTIKLFLPYVCMFFVNLVYFSYFLPSQPAQGGFFGQVGYRTQAALRTIICIASTINTAQEVVQIYRNGKDYFYDVWNYFFQISNFLGMIIVLLHGQNSTSVSLNTLIQLSSVQIVIQWVLLYYWMRLFPQLAFYVTMIQETIKDIFHFFLMFLMCIGAFANAAYVLNLIKSQPNADEDIEPLWNKAFGVPFIDSFFNQYQIGLGNFYLDPYSSSPAAVLVYLYFILATLFTQILFLNMLIAIMSETYERVSEARARSALMESTQLYADFMWAISLTKTMEKKRYLYVVKPIEQTDQDESSEIKLVHQRLTGLIQENANKNKEEIADLQNKVNQILYQMNQRFDTIMNLLKPK